MSALPQNVVLALKRIVWDDLSYLQRRELVRVMIERAVYSQEQLIFHININPQLYNSFLSTYHINHNSRPMEYTVNGDNVTIVRPVVLRRYANTRFGGGVIRLFDNFVVHTGNLVMGKWRTPARFYK